MIVQQKANQMSYYDRLEDADAAIITAFNQDLNYFKSILFNKKGWRNDAYAIDKKGRTVHIEIKQRQGKYKDFNEFIKKYNSCYLAADKIPWMQKIMQSGYTLSEKELFISIFDDGNTILLFDLLKPQKVEWFPNSRTWNPGQNKWTFETNIGFYWKNAVIFKKDITTNHYKKLTKKEIDNLGN